VYNDKSDKILQSVKRVKIVDHLGLQSKWASI
jgi:hypothetical protein